MRAKDVAKHKIVTPMAIDGTLKKTVLIESFKITFLHSFIDRARKYASQSIAQTNSLVFSQLDRWVNILKRQGILERPLQARSCNYGTFLSTATNRVHVFAFPPSRLWNGLSALRRRRELLGPLIRHTLAITAARVDVSRPIGKIPSRQSPRVPPSELTEVWHRAIFV